MAQLTRFFLPEFGVRVGLLDAGQVYDRTSHWGTIAARLRSSTVHTSPAIDELVTQARGDVVRITIYRIGELVDTVKVV